MCSLQMTAVLETFKRQELQTFGEQEATRNKCIATSNRCLTSSNKKLLGTSASLLGASALLVVTRSY